MRSLLWIPKDDLRYTYAVSLVRALEWTLLSRKTLEAMARAKDQAEALEELAETSYAAHMSPGQRPEDFELVLQRVLDQTYSLFRALVKDEELREGVMAVHEIHNLKASLKAMLAKAQVVGLVPFGLVSGETLERAVTSRRFELLPPLLAEAAGRALRDFEIHQDAQRLEAILDTAAMSARVKALGSSGSPVLAQYATALADTTNLKTLVRLSRMGADGDVLAMSYVPGGSIPLATLEPVLSRGVPVTEVYASSPYAKAVREGLAYLQERGSYAVLDRECENLLMETLRPTRFVFFSPAPVVTFLLAREHEVHMVRLVMVAKANGIPAELIVARLSNLYV